MCADCYYIKRLMLLKTAADVDLLILDWNLMDGFDFLYLCWCYQEPEPMVKPAVQQNVTPLNPVFRVREVTLALFKMIFPVIDFWYFWNYISNNLVCVLYKSKNLPEELSSQRAVKPLSTLERPARVDPVTFNPICDISPIKSQEPHWTRSDQSGPKTSGVSTAGV